MENSRKRTYRHTIKVTITGEKAVEMLAHVAPQALQSLPQLPEPLADLPEIELKVPEIDLTLPELQELPKLPAPRQTHPLRLSHRNGARQ